MENLFKSKKARIVLCIVAALLVIGLIGGILAAMGSSYKISFSSSKTSSTSVIPSSSSGSGSGSSNSGSTVSDNPGNDVSGGDNEGGESGSSNTEEPMPSYTVTYHLGSSADGGDVPSEESFSQGSDVSVYFGIHHPTLTDYDFVGWAESDGASVAEFTESGTNTITYISRDYDLYPVFEAAQSQSQPTTMTLTLDLSGISSSTSAVVQEWLSMMNIWNNVGSSVHGGDSATDFTVNSGTRYRVKVEGSDYDSANFTGTYSGYEYSKETLTGNTHSSDSATVLSNPSDYTSTEWEFTSGDGGTIEFSTK